MEGGTERKESGPGYTGPAAYPRQGPDAGSAEVFYIKNFATYSTLPGAHLTRGEYARTKDAAEKPGVEVNEVYATNAQTYADKAGIVLSPKTLVLYSILRKDENISSDLLHGDQQRLAEVLRIEGRAADAEKLIAAYPVIKF